MTQLEQSTVSLSSVKAIAGFIISTLLSGFSVYSAMEQKVNRLELRLEHMEKGQGEIVKEQADFKRDLNSDIAEIKKTQVEMLLKLTRLTADVERK